MMWPATDLDGGLESALPFGGVAEVAVLTSMLNAAVTGASRHVPRRGVGPQLTAQAMAAFFAAHPWQGAAR
jgi:hypothetical protein